MRHPLLDPSINIIQHTIRRQTPKILEIFYIVSIIIKFLKRIKYIRDDQFLPNFKLSETFNYQLYSHNLKFFYFIKKGELI